MRNRSASRRPGVSRRHRHASLIFAISAICALSWSIPRAAGAEAVPFPPAGLVDLSGPQQAAVVRHEIEARLDPPSHGLRAVDVITIVHAPGVPAERPASFLLWRDLNPVSVVPQLGASGGEVPPRDRGRDASGEPPRALPKRLSFEVRDRMKPRDFWTKPPYDELEGYERARQVDIRPEPPVGEWPETLRVSVEYEGTLMDSLRPPIASYQRSFEETAGLIEERGAYLCGSSFWIPSRPGDVFTFRLTGYVPAEWRVVSQGDWLGMDKAGPPAMGKGAAPPASGPSRGDIWDCSHPMEEVYLVAGPWSVHEADHRGVKVMTLTYADTDSSIYNRYIRGTGRYLDLYQSLIGPYPFGKFALVENFWQTGFGMPSFTLLGYTVIRLPFILDTSYGHEILHNWWGNGVFVDAAKGNWCEGLTVYGADYLYKEREGPEAAAEYRRSALVGYLDYVSGSEEIPLARFRARNDAATQAIGYSKSMMVIHQLRREAGELRFWEACRRFFRENLWKRASWDDFLESFPEVPAIDPVAFRETWIERTGAPLISVQDVRVAPEGKGWRVQATLTQALPGGSAEGEPFPVVVPVRLRWADRDSTWQVSLPGWSAIFSTLAERKPEQLLVDPDFEVIRRVHRTEIPPTLSQTLGADSVTVVLATGLDPAAERACRALAESWAVGQALRVVEEWKEPAGWQPPGSAWYFGLGPGARSLLAGVAEVRMPSGPRAPTRVETTPSSGKDDPNAGAPPGGAVGSAGPNPWRVGGEDHASGRSFVFAGSRANAAQIAWAVVVPADSAAVKAIESKVPHYGKYSYLVFDGSKVVAKGVWSKTDSPLVVDLAALQPIDKRNGASPAGKIGRERKKGGEGK